MTESNGSDSRVRRRGPRPQPNRWLAFHADELDEIALSLDHRLADAEAGNAYVYHDIVAELLAQLFIAHPSIREAHHVEHWYEPLERSRAICAADASAEQDRRGFITMGGLHRG